MNKKIAVLLKVIVSLGLITFLINQVDFKGIVNILKNVDITMIVYALNLQCVFIVKHYLLAFKYELPAGSCDKNLEG